VAEATSYTDETGRPLAVRLREGKYSLKESLLEKSKLAKYTYEQGHGIGWDGGKIFEIESNSRYRKYKESAHMACLTNPISQLCLDISPIRISLISHEVINSLKKSV
jgi:hypothetical protein